MTPANPRHRHRHKPAPASPGPVPPPPDTTPSDPKRRWSRNMSLYDLTGGRKYLTASERAAFLRRTTLADRPVRALCLTLYYTGCRLSEALALTADRADLTAGVLVFETLKTRAAVSTGRSRPPQPARNPRPRARDP
ncbi:hypothetical protein [Acidiphilium sp.]|uniref:hypothetical protein n=1 Tax=Acidiphilium sp. TaxID=527 RepID=UPI003D092A35